MKSKTVTLKDGTIINPFGDIVQLPAVRIRERMLPLPAGIVLSIKLRRDGDLLDVFCGHCGERMVVTGPMRVTLWSRGIERQWVQATQPVRCSRDMWSPVMALLPALSKHDSGEITIYRNEHGYFLGCRCHRRY